MAVGGHEGGLLCGRAPVSARGGRCGVGAGWVAVGGQHHTCGPRGGELVSCRPLTRGDGGLSEDALSHRLQGHSSRHPWRLPGLAVDFHRILPLSPRTGERPQARGPGTDFSHVSEGAAVAGEFRQCHPRLPSAHQGWTWPRREGSRPRAGQSPAGGGCSGCEGVSWGGRGPVACRSHAAGARVERGPGEGCTARSCPYREEGRGQHRPVLPRPSRRPCPGTGALLAQLCGREGRQGGRVALSARAGCAVRWAAPCPAGQARTCSAADHESSSQRWEGADPLGAAGPGQCVRAAPREDAPLQKARSPRGPGETEAPLGRSQLVQTPPAVPEAASAPMGLRCRGPPRRCGPRAVGAARHRGSICKARETAWALERETPGDTGGGPARTVCPAHRHT